MGQSQMQKGKSLAHTTPDIFIYREIYVPVLCAAAHRKHVGNKPSREQGAILISSSSASPWELSFSLINASLLPPSGPCFTLLLV